MHIESLKITDIRSYAGTHEVNFSKNINLLVGKNNSGKSTILKCLQLLQRDGSDLDYILNFNRLKTEGNISIQFGDPDNRINRLFSPQAPDRSILFPRLSIRIKNKTHEINIQQAHKPTTTAHTPRELNSSQFPREEPDNLLIPFLSKRKVNRIEHKLDYESTAKISEDLRNLTAQVNKLRTADEATSQNFINYSKSILGFAAGISATRDGGEVSLYVDSVNYIPLSSMGEGTANILGLITKLCLYEGKVFLIEELENDLHPEALKALLDLIVEKSEKNQFIISTHSNIVLRHLGAQPKCKTMSLEMDIIDKIPTTKITDLSSDPQTKIDLLQKLGYDCVDFGLWKGYLILEESSAEAIINQILIPHFAPKLIGKIKTIASQGVDDIEPRAIDFHRLFVFTHTAEIYSKSAWIRADGDDAGKKALDSLRLKFKNAEQDKIKNYTRPQFELYYPIQFQDAATKALSIKNKKDRKSAKEILCKEVLEWAAENPMPAKDAFLLSAEEIVCDLKEIEKKLS